MKNKTFGSALIVAGTAIGAGMLAMPLATAGIGFRTVIIMLFGLWALMCYTALLLVEVYQHHSPDTGLATLAFQYFGSKGKWLTSFSVLFLMYALLAAYISGAGTLLSSSLNEWLNMNIPDYIGVLIFTLVGGLIVCIGTHSVDIVNRCLFISKIAIFIIMLCLLMPHVQTKNLLMLPVEQGLIFSAIPVMFTSFGFHGSVPSIIKYMNGDTKKLKKVFIFGSLLPLFAYIFWQLATLGSFDSNTFLGILAEHSGLNGLMRVVRETVSQPHIETIVHTFADLALATSFLGVALGLFDYLADLCSRKANTQGRCQTGILTFTPPLVFALFYPTGFIMALGFAAAALAVLALILPVLLTFKSRERYQGDHYYVIGGNLTLFVVFLAGIGIIAIQILSTMGILPEVG